DEPTGSLSVEAAGEIMALFEKINLRGTTVILATHNEALPSTWPREKIVLQQGRTAEAPAGAGAECPPPAGIRT
ncbi:MAG TPA: hypothetical protein VLS90_01095, partial [Thermodesulfobacteriota bacterium]|nr:hypothetical protein [Thermodesulfobacteriota bacterium]